jgi:hypothetical protein
MSHRNYLEVLTPQNSQLIFIDQQPQMAFGVQSIDRQTLKNNVVGLAKAAKVFHIPVTLTTVETESFSGHTYPELLSVFPDHPLLERSSMNSWDDQNARCTGRQCGQGAQENHRLGPVDRGLQQHLCAVGHARCGLRDLHGGRCVGRHIAGCTQLRHAAHGASGRGAGDLAAGAAGVAA